MGWSSQMGPWLKSTPGTLFTRHQAVVVALDLEVRLEPACQAVYPPKASVVAGVLVLGAGVSQANKEANHGAGLWRRCQKPPSLEGVG
jgi:hypothetical protein